MLFPLMGGTIAPGRPSKYFFQIGSYRPAVSAIDASWVWIEALRKDQWSSLVCIKCMS